MKELTLTQDKKTILDEDDFEKYHQFKWFAQKKRNNFYAARTVRKDGKKTTVYLHREIMGAIKGQFVDHINRDTLDNTKANLRICSNQENAFNQSSRGGYKGVTKRKTAWVARIMLDYKEIYIGSFVTENEAALAYNEAAKMYFGEFAVLNEVKT